MDNKDMIDDIIAMLDNSVSNGVGHLNISTVDSTEESKMVEQLGCLDCSKGDLACSVPTLHKGIEDLEEADS